MGLITTARPHGPRLSSFNSPGLRSGRSTLAYPRPRGVTGWRRWCAPVPAVQNRGRQGSGRTLAACWRIAVAGSLVVVVGKQYPARIRTPAGRLSVRAVHADAGSGIDVELSVDDQRIARRDGDICRETGVVVDLERLAGRGPDVEALVAARFHRGVQHRRVERDLDVAGALDHVLVKGLVVRGRTLAARH